MPLRCVEILQVCRLVGAAGITEVGAGVRARAWSRRHAAFLESRISGLNTQEGENLAWSIPGKLTRAWEFSGRAWNRKPLTSISWTAKHLPALNKIIDGTIHLCPITC